MADEAYWQYEVDSCQRAGTTQSTIARRHGEAHRTAPSDGNEPNDEHSEKSGEDGFDSHGIPTGI